MDQISVEEIPMLTDDQLLGNLKRCGLTFGPITATTRRLYEKRLRNYLEGNGDKTVNLTSNSILADIANDSTAHKSRSSPRKKPAVQSSVTIEPPIIVDNRTATVTTQATTTTTTTSRQQDHVFKAPSSTNSEPVKAQQHQPQRILEQHQHHQPQPQRVLEQHQPQPQRAQEQQQHQPQRVLEQQHHQPQPQRVLEQQHHQPQPQRVLEQPKPVQQPQTVIHNLNNFNFNPTEMPLPNFTSTLKPNKHHGDENRPFVSSVAKTYGDDFDRQRYVVGTSASSSTMSPATRRNPSPIKDKFAERLNNYGLLGGETKTPVVTLASSSSSSSSANGIGIGGTPSAKFDKFDPTLRSRLIRNDIRESPRIEPRQPLSSRIEKPNEYQTPKKPGKREREI